FKAQAQSSDITYILPASNGSAGQVLINDGAGMLSWSSSPVIGLSILKDADSDTKIQVEKTTDEDIIRFDVGGAERWKMTASRLEPSNSGNSVFIGFNAGLSDDLTSNANTFVGNDAGRNNTSGSVNSALGHNALYSTTSGWENTAIGANALYSNTANSRNTAIGYEALYNFNSSASNATKNTALGYRAGYGEAESTGVNNIFVGYQAGDNVSTGNNNIVVGCDIDLPSATANNQMVLGNANTLYGDLQNNRIGIGTTSPTEKLELRNGNLLLSNTSAAGELRFAEPGSGGSNTTSFKAQAQSSDITYILPASNGSTGQVLINDGAGILSWSSSPAIALSILKDADSDTKIQVEKTTDEDIIRFDLGGAERWNMTASRLVPSNSGYSVFIGENAGLSDDLTTNVNVFVGNDAGRNNTSGSFNSALGHNALYSTTSGWENTAIGANALYSNTTNSRNTAIGYEALFNFNSSAANSTKNTALGYRAGFGASGSTGVNNIFVGYQAGDNVASGSNNIVLGYDVDLPSATANYQMVLGNANTLYGDLQNNRIGIGTTSPNAPLQFGNTATNRKIVLYEDANNDHQYFGFGINTAAMRYQIAGTDSDHIFYAGNGSSSSNELARIKGNGTLRVSSLSTNGPVYSNNNILTNTNPSDRNLKDNILPIGNSLEKVLALRPVTFIWKSNSKPGVGFIAQEVEEVIPELVNTNDDGTKGIYSLEMIPYLVKALQEQQIVIEQLKIRIQHLEQQPK
ncbi:MAG: tail fiber domain-containing protein, partial [Bacteroidales bacterium]|nr:tail fiber domain-containing protein [Bacteroidales bacterium]